MRSFLGKSLLLALLLSSAAHAETAPTPAPHNCEAALSRTSEDGQAHYAVLCDLGHGLKQELSDEEYSKEEAEELAKSMNDAGPAR